jgi:hypothetical protein
MTRKLVRPLPQQPYLLIFEATGATYPLTSEDAERLVAEYPLVRVSSASIVLRGDDGRTAKIRPAANYGGGISFRWTS